MEGIETAKCWARLELRSNPIRSSSTGCCVSLALEARTTPVSFLHRSNVEISYSQFATGAFPELLEQGSHVFQLTLQARHGSLVRCPLVQADIDVALQLTVIPLVLARHWMER